MRVTCSRNCLAELLRRHGQTRCPSQLSPARSMTRGRSVMERSKKKRVNDLEVVIERCKVVSKVLAVLDALKMEEEHVTPLKRLEILRPQLGLAKPHKVAHFVHRSPQLFQVCRDGRGVMWAGLSPQAEALVEEEARLLEEHSRTAAQYVTRLLMMSVGRRLPVDKIAHFRRDMGLPHNFRTRWVHMFPELFRLVTQEDGDYLELVSWNPDWAVTEHEKNVAALAGDTNANSNAPTPGELSLPFHMKFPPDFKSYYKFRGKAHHYVKTGNTEQFQKTSYLSPYAEATGLTPGSQEFDKRAVAVMHEILSFTLEKRLVTDHLTHFRREFVMPQKLMRLLLKHYGIFYVSERGKRLSVFLTEAYDGTELIKKAPLVRWKEKVLQLTGYRGKNKNIGKVHESSDSDDNLFGGDDDDILNLESEDSDDVLDDGTLADDDEMDLGDLSDYTEDVSVKSS
ncbi:protein WHAT'S THIS FACTOR 1, chloroplastic-like [Lolium rigidum]|uniref:protein WHAT'S THIS FACTOR 1, chloroplastic-like n=1 Tax=Lolium rigidum TaxID=89674 RepID=UPI001F5D4A78|nr:protein WHAT'S THIS FACTOR 1, chloroplastic-like [Lolium rigidum]